MADFRGIAAAGRSIVRFLNRCFEDEPPIPDQNTRAVLVRTEELDVAASNVINAPALSVFLYRVDFNKTMRAAWSGVGSQTGRAHLPLDLHYLLTPWAENADYEHRILGKGMQCLESNPVLGGPLLDPLGSWAPHEAVQISLEEITTEAVMRTFDSLPVDYKLSVPYVARIVRIDGPGERAARPVTTLVAGTKPSATP